MWLAAAAAVISCKLPLQIVQTEVKVLFDLFPNRPPAGARTSAIWLGGSTKPNWTNRSMARDDSWYFVWRQKFGLATRARKFWKRRAAASKRAPSESTTQPGAAISMPDRARKEVGAAAASGEPAVHTHCSPFLYTYCLVRYSHLLLLH